MAEFRCTVVTERRSKTNTANNNFSQISRGIVRPPFEIASNTSKKLFLRGKSGGGRASLVPFPPRASTSFPRVRVAPPQCSRLKLRHAEQILSRAPRKKTNRWHPLAFKLVPKKPTNAYTRFVPPTRREINLDKKLSVGKRKSSNRGKNLANNFYSLSLDIYREKSGRSAREDGGETGGGSALEMTRGFHNSVVVSTGLCSPRYVNPRWE